MNQIPSHRAPLEGTRADTLRRLVHALLDDPKRRFELRDRTLDDPTIALLDSWATMADVLAFYDERIQAEGYLDSSIQPESVLALVGLTAVRPRPPVGSSVHLAYLLHPDPGDVAAVLPRGMLTQSVPAEGEEVQTFETEVDLVARPSWNELPLRGGRPKVDLALANGTDTLRIAGAGDLLAPNDHLLWTRGERAVVLRVVSATSDPAAGTTDVVVAGLDRKITPTALTSGSPAGGPDTPLPQANDEWSAARVMDGLRTHPRTPADDPAADPEPAPNFGSTTARSTLSPTELFAPRSDAIPRVMSALRPDDASSLYTLLAGVSREAPDGPPALEAMRVTAAPFGSTAQQQVVFDSTGRPGGAVDWPVSGTLDLLVRLTGDQDALQAMREGDVTTEPDSLGEQVVSIVRALARLGPFRRFGGASDRSSEQEESGGAEGRPESSEDESSTSSDKPARRTRTDRPEEKPSEEKPPEEKPAPESEQPTRLPRGLVAAITATVKDRAVQHRTVTLSERPRVDLDELGRLEVTMGEDVLVATYTAGTVPVPDFVATVTFTQEDESVTFTIGDDSCVWYPGDGKGGLDAVLGSRRLEITFTKDAEELIISLRIPLPFDEDERKVMHLDRPYAAIVPGSRVVVTRAIAPDDAVPEDVTYPIVSTVLAADTVSVARYGLTAEVTRLSLDRPWVGGVTSLGDIRSLRIHGAPETLKLQPADITSDVGKDALELESVHPGLEPGRQLVVVGERTDLPVPTQAVTGELVEIRQVQLPTPVGGSPFTLLTLREPLQHTYRRASVTIHGNVVAAHQGATVTEVLGPAAPGIAHQQFTLAQAPLLAEPAPDGISSTLEVRVDGQRYQEVTRFDADTPATSYLCGLDATGRTTVTFAAALPSVSASVVATYRAGRGGNGNVRARQVTQALTRPLSVSSVVNPLPASGGADADTAESLRARATTGLQSLGCAVTLDDYGDLARSWPGVGKAKASMGNDGSGRAVVVIDVAGVGPAPLLDDSDLVRSLQTSLTGPEPTVEVLVRSVEMLTMFVRVRAVPVAGWDWETIESATRAALDRAFGFATRQIGQDVLLADLLVATQSVPGVVSTSITGLALVSSSADFAVLSGLPKRLDAAVPGRTRVAPGVAGERAAIAFVNPAVPNSVIVEEGAP